jgi:hypothetical protein
MSQKLFTITPFDAWCINFKMYQGRQKRVCREKRPSKMSNAGYMLTNQLRYQFIVRKHLHRNNIRLTHGSGSIERNEEGDQRGQEVGNHTSMGKVPEKPPIIQHPYLTSHV